MSRLPLTPPLFLMAVRMSSLDSSLYRHPVLASAGRVYLSSMLTYNMHGLAPWTHVQLHGDMFRVYIRAFLLRITSKTIGCAGTSSYSTTLQAVHMADPSHTRQVLAPTWMDPVH